MADDLPLHWRLHLCDEAAVRHEAELKKLPARLAAQDAKVAAEQRRVDANAKSASDRVQRRRAAEGEIAAFETQEAGFKRQLDAVTNQQQFEAVQHQIAGVAAKRSEAETLVLTLMDEEEALAAERPALADALARAEAARADERAKCATIEGEAKAALAALDARRAEAVAALDAAARSRYERTRAAREGRAVAAIEKDACGACFRGLAPQALSEAKKRDRLLPCDGCGRLLMFAPEGAPPA
ncbi:MAG: C4-type zinc ribbon domain-containing protein [Candidatus Eisenbacteria bacterium]